MKIYSDQEKLFQDIKEILKDREKFIIGIDGFLSSGKSKLAKELTTFLNIPYYDWDNIILSQKQDRTYDFKLDIVRKIMSTESKIIIEIVLLRQILSLLDIKPDFYIYTKILDKRDCWIDKSNHEISIITLNRDSSSLPRALTDHSPYENQIIDYHRKAKPHLISEFIFIEKIDTEKDDYFYIDLQ